jgi:hypothetical protein
MKKFALLGMVLLISVLGVSKTQAANVDVRVNTPAGQVEVGHPPPPPVVVVPPPAPATVVVEKRVAAPPPPPPAPPPPPSGGCHCELVPGPASLSGLQCLVFLFLLGWGSLFLMALKRERKAVAPRPSTREQMRRPHL